MKIVTKKFLSLALAGVMFTSTGAATVTAHADETLTDTSLVQSNDEDKLWILNHSWPWGRLHPEVPCMPGEPWHEPCFHPGDKVPEGPKVKKYPNGRRI